MNDKRLPFMIAPLLAVATLLGGCNTMRGLGEGVRHTAEGLGEGVKDVGRGIGEDLRDAGESGSTTGDAGSSANAPAEPEP